MIRIENITSTEIKGYLIKTNKYSGKKLVSKKIGINWKALWRDIKRYIKLPSTIQRLLFLLAAIVSKNQLFGFIFSVAKNGTDSTYEQASPGQTYNFNHTVGASLSNSCLVVLQTNPNAGAVTGITYNNVAMTVQSAHEGNVVWMTLATLVSPDAGTHAVAITAGHEVGGPTYTKVVAITLTGVNQSTPVDVVATSADATNSSPTISRTTTTSNAWLFAILWSGAQTIDSWTSPAVQDVLMTVSANVGFAHKVVTSAGSSAIAATLSGSVHWAMLLFGVMSDAVSPSPSISPSVSLSASPSISPSVSPSISPSVSPAAPEYTRGDYGNLPTNDNDLETAYSAGDVADVLIQNGVYIEQTGAEQYMIHQFKDYVGDTAGCTVKCVAQSSLAPSASTFYLQIYNQALDEWEEKDSDNTTTADTDFTLTFTIYDLTDYKTDEKCITCRVYQLAI